MSQPESIHPAVDATVPDPDSLPEGTRLPLPLVLYDPQTGKTLLEVATREAGELVELVLYTPQGFSAASVDASENGVSLVLWETAPADPTSPTPYVELAADPESGGRLSLKPAEPLAAPLRLGFLD